MLSEFIIPDGISRILTNIWVDIPDNVHLRRIMASYLVLSLTDSIGMYCCERLMHDVYNVHAGAQTCHAYGTVIIGIGRGSSEHSILLTTCSYEVARRRLSVCA
jgi:hypothetical protein